MSGVDIKTGDCGSFNNNTGGGGQDIMKPTFKKVSYTRQQGRGMPNITAHMVSISAMNEYADKSPEELRLEYYRAGGGAFNPGVANTRGFNCEEFGGTNTSGLNDDVKTSTM